MEVKKPLSQTGLRRIPRSPYQRPIDETTGRPAKRKTLEAANEALADKGCYLHPTKGFRPVSGKRSEVALLTAEIRAGFAPFSTRLMRRRLSSVSL